jgi:orotate phosphoribosyltransferase
MTDEQVLNIFREAGALLEGHFVYTSGRHGRHFIQASRVMQYPKHVQTLCRALAAPFQSKKIALVVGPATGGIILAYETARHLGCRCAFTEKDGDGGMALKRGIRIEPGTRVLVVEDVITTGGSVKKTISHLRERGAEVVGAGALVDRSGGEARFDCPFHALARLTLESFAADDPRVAQLPGPPVDPDDLVV